MLQEDRLENLLSLTQKHSIRLLQELETDRLVCWEEVAEKGIRKRDREGGAEAQVRELQAELAGTVSAGAATDLEDTRKVKTKVWFINPRYFVDVVRFRIHIMRDVLRKQESHSLERQSMYACSSKQCVYQASTADAMKHMMAPGGAIGLNVPAQQAGLLARRAGQGSTTVSATPVFSCPACNAPMRKKDGRAVMAAAANRLDNFNSQLTLSGIADCLKSLNSVALGANRPSDKLEERLVTLRGDNKAGYKQLSAHEQHDYLSGSGAPAFGIGTSNVADAEVVVELTGAAASRGPTSTTNTMRKGVDISSVPEFLQRSAFTGTTAQSIGFLKAQTDSGRELLEDAGPTTANFFEVLSKMQFSSLSQTQGQINDGLSPMKEEAKDLATSVQESAETGECGSDDEGWS